MALAGVHVKWIKAAVGIPAAAIGDTPVAAGMGQAPYAPTMTGLDLAIGAAAVQVPAGVVAAKLASPTYSAFRYALGDDDQVAVPAAHGLRFDGQGPETIGVAPGQYFVTAADTELP